MEGSNDDIPYEPSGLVSRLQSKSTCGEAKWSSYGILMVSLMYTWTSGESNLSLQRPGVGTRGGVVEVMSVVTSEADTDVFPSTEDAVTTGGTLVAEIPEVDDVGRTSVVAERIVFNEVGPRVAISVINSPPRASGSRSNVLWPP